MTVLKQVRLLGTWSVLVTIPLVSAYAQSQTTASPSPATPPAAMQPQTVMPPAQQQAGTKVSPLLGLSVFSLEGSKLGSVRGVEAGADGAITAIYLITGGFLGFGGKLVAIPVGKFTHDPEKIVVLMSVDEVTRLPAVEEQG
jgi:hypothetical protein